MTLSRAEKAKKAKEQRMRRTLRLKIAALALFILCAFIYLTQWLEKPAVPGQNEHEAASSRSEKVSLPSHSTAIEEVETSDNAPSLNGEQALPLTGEETVRLSFVGDVMFAGKVEPLLKQHGFDYPYEYVRTYLNKADITVANLETPLTGRGEAQSKQYVYRSSPENAQSLRQAGIDVVSLANNHILDYGVDGLLDTLEYLNEAGIMYAGAGRHSQEAYGHVIVESGGMRIAFLSFSRVVPQVSWYAGKGPGLAGTYDVTLPLKAIAKARKEADLVVVLAHWGKEREPKPTTEQVDLAHQYVDAGADLVIGSHPHILQGFEHYHDKWIAYSLGNFIFTTNEVPETWESMILNAECTKDRACRLDMIPILTKWAQPVRMIEEEGRKLYQKLSERSVHAIIDENGKISPAASDHSFDESFFSQLNQ